jgi:hypothetical protein
MMRFIVCALCLVMALPAYAQQPRQIDLQAFKDKLGDEALATALCDSDAKAAAIAAQHTIADLQKQLEEAKAAKMEDKK